MKTTFLTVLLILGVIIFGMAKKKPKVITLSNGLKYIAYIHHDTLPKVHIDDVVAYHLILKNNLDSLIFDTHKEFGAQQLNIEKSIFSGDLNAGIQLMAKNDSFCFLIKTDSLYGSFMPHFAFPHKYMKFYVTILDFLPKEKWKEKEIRNAARQAEIDDSLLHNYFAQNNKNPTSAELGLYYLLKENGSNKVATVGDTVTVNYTGKLTNGVVFDSNTDPKFRHVEPFQFVLGKGSVIKGWDKGLTYFSEGSKGVLYIPSGLAYGKRSSGGIPANGNLVFDIEIVKIAIKKIATK
jgi:FKBP-type peptidyl-prolyl cis-trans isomerase FkpA